MAPCHVESARWSAFYPRYLFPGRSYGTGGERTKHADSFFPSGNGESSDPLLTLWGAHRSNNGLTPRAGDGVYRMTTHKAARNHTPRRECGGSFIDLMIALLLVSFTGVALLETRHRSLLSLREVSERLHRYLETEAHSSPTFSTCLVDSFAIHCEQTSPDQTIVLIGR